MSRAKSASGANRLVDLVEDSGSREALRPSGCSDYTIVSSMRFGFAAIGFTGKLALLVPLEAATKAGPRQYGHLRVTPVEELCYETPLDSWSNPTAVLECTSRELDRTFCVLAEDVARSLAEAGDLPAWSGVLHLVRQWERLLRARRQLSKPEEIGLWGELSLIASSEDVDVAVHSWLGPLAAPVDFFANGRGFECKASLKRLHHHLSTSQADKPCGDWPVLLVSLWVGPDLARGSSIGDLVLEIRSRLHDSTEFDRKLLGAGYSDDDVGLYTERFLMMEPPQLFDMDDVPRIREYDEGVTRIRYEIDLDLEDALPREEAEAALSALSEQAPVPIALQAPLAKRKAS